MSPWDLNLNRCDSPNFWISLPHGSPKTRTDQPWSIRICKFLMAKSSPLLDVAQDLYGLIPFQAPNTSQPLSETKAFPDSEVRFLFKDLRRQERALRNIFLKWKVNQQSEIFNVLSCASLRNPVYVRCSSPEKQWHVHVPAYSSWICIMAIYSPKCWCRKRNGLLISLTDLEHR